RATRAARRSNRAPSRSDLDGRAHRLTHRAVAHVLEDEHVEPSTVVAAGEPDLAVERGGVVVRAEEHVPEREVRVVPDGTVHVVMQSVRLRPLHERTDTAWRAHVHVLEDADE